MNFNKNPLCSSFNLYTVSFLYLFPFKPKSAHVSAIARGAGNAGRPNSIHILFQNYHISACNTQYSFFLHCRDDYGAEALRGHWGLDDVGVLPAGFVQNPEVVVDHDCPFAGFFCRRFALKIPPVCVNEGKSCCLFCILFQEDEEGLKEFKVFFLRQSGYAFLVIVACLFVKVWRIEDDKVGLFFGTYWPG